MQENYKKCHLCAEEIPIDTTQCIYCGARYHVTCKGYCTRCHTIRDTDHLGKCMICGQETIDWKILSEPLDIPPSQEEPVGSTPQNQRLPDSTSILEILPLKGQGVINRFSAWLTDIIIISLLVGLILAFFLIPSSMRISSIDQINQDFITSLFSGVTLAVLPATWFLYFFIFEAALGTTPGKALNHFRVVRKEGSRITWGQAAIRSLFGLLETNIIGAIAIWASPHNQRIGDLVAGTLVVCKELVARAELNPPALSLVFHNFRRVNISRLMKGTYHKFGFYKDLVLEGISPSNIMIKEKLRGNYYRPQFDLLSQNIEEHYQLTFPKKVKVWRLILFLLALILLLSGTLTFINQILPISDMDNTARDLERTDVAAEFWPTQNSVTLTSSPEPTPTMRPSLTPTPLPLEVDFDSIADVKDDTLVVMKGRLALMSSTLCDYKCGLLLENPANTAQKIIIFVTIGDNPNQMKALPDNYTKGDIQVILDDGSIAMVGYRLIITGSKYTTTSGEPCIYTIRKIEFNQIP